MPETLKNLTKKNIEEAIENVLTEWSYSERLRICGPFHDVEELTDDIVDRIIVTNIINEPVKAF